MADRITIVFSLQVMITLFPMRYLSRHSLGRVIRPLLSIVTILYCNWNHQVLCVFLMYK